MLGLTTEWCFNGAKLQNIHEKKVGGTNIPPAIPKNGDAPTSISKLRRKIYSSRRHLYKLRRKI